MRIALVCAAAISLVCAALLSQPAPAADNRQTRAAGSKYLIPQIDRWREETWRWQRLMAKPRTHSNFSARESLSPDYREWVLRLWKKRALRARRQALNPPSFSKWLCIFRHERHPRHGWRTNTGNGYYGGLQMDIAFQRRYGWWLLRRKGTANRWTPIEQIWVAERGRRVQGWYAWPSTARYCGLI
jgi:hypothetical protein